MYRHFAQDDEEAIPLTFKQLARRLHTCRNCPFREQLACS